MAGARRRFLRQEAPDADVLYDRVARFWRSELHVDPDDGPSRPGPLLETASVSQVIVARVGGLAPCTAEHPGAHSDPRRRRRLTRTPRPLPLRQRGRRRS